MTAVLLPYLILHNCCRTHKQQLHLLPHLQLNSLCWHQLPTASVHRDVSVAIASSLSLPPPRLALPTPVVPHVRASATLRAVVSWR